MVSRTDVIRTAREYLGTKFHHQGRQKSLGVDCVGFIACVARDAGLITQELFNSIPSAYSRQPSGGQLRRLMGGLLVHVPLDARAPGDIVLMRFEIDPQHIAMLTHPDYLIHCGRDGVVEHRIDSAWRARIVRVYRFPALRS